MPRPLSRSLAALRQLPAALELITPPNSGSPLVSSLASPLGHTYRQQPAHVAEPPILPCTYVDLCHVPTLIAPALCRQVTDLVPPPAAAAAPGLRPRGYAALLDPDPGPGPGMGLDAEQDGVPLAMAPDLPPALLLAHQQPHGPPLGLGLGLDLAEGGGPQPDAAGGAAAAPAAVPPHAAAAAAGGGGGGHPRHSSARSLAWLEVVGQVLAVRPDLVVACRPHSSLQLALGDSARQSLSQVRWAAREVLCACMREMSLPAAVTQWIGRGRGRWGEGGQAGAEALGPAVGRGRSRTCIAAGVPSLLPLPPTPTPPDP